MRSRHLFSLTALALTPTFAACGTDAAADRGDPGSDAEAGYATARPPEVVVRTYDFQFDAPDTVASGPTAFRLRNEGPDFHHIWLVRLESGKTLDDLMAYLAAGHASMPDWAIDVGGPNTPGEPGGETVATLDLEPGRTAEDFLGWVMTRQGPRPGSPVGGVTGLATGRGNVTTVDFQPGDYALLCFVPDAKDGQPHVAHGMIKHFRVG